MKDDPENLVLQQLRAIREEQAVTNGKIGTLAEGMVSLRGEVAELRKDIAGLRADVNGLRIDIRTIAIAVDQHSSRLDRIEVCLHQ